MNKEVLDLRFLKIIEKWTIYRLVEQHLYYEESEDLKRNIVNVINITINKHKNTSEICILQDELSYKLQLFLDDNNIEVDEYSCDKMANIVIEIYKEFIENRTDIFNKICKVKEVNIPENNELHVFYRIQKYISYF